MKRSPFSLSVTPSLIGLALLASEVQAHGYMDYPAARQQLCDIDGGYWDSVDGSTIPNAACRTAFLASSWTPFVQKPEFSTLVSNYNSQAAVEVAIPDGQLCSAGDQAKQGINIPSPDWKKTNIDLSNQGKITLQYRANTPHNPSFWKIYLSKANYDSSTMPLAWSDLDLIAEFGNIPTVELNGHKYYQMEVMLPTDRTGNAVIYSRWQRQDPAGEGFYNCSDIRFNNPDDSGNPDNYLEQWISSGNYLASTANAIVGDTVWFRVFDENGNEIVFEKFPITNETESIWAEDLAKLVNQEYPQQVQIGLKNSASESIDYQVQDLYSNLVYLTNTHYTHRLEVKSGNNAPVITAPSTLNVSGGKSITFDVSANDVDGDPLIFSIDKGDIIAKTDSSITINYQAAETTSDLSDVLTVSVGDPISTSKASITIAITATSDNTAETTWKSDVAYNLGDTVVFSGIAYTAKWWTKGDEPGVSSAWEGSQASTNTEWKDNTIYTSGDIVLFQESSYKAQWWNQGEQPDSSAAWVIQLADQRPL
ncbi:MAG: lytic polysaccharide monooxygenase [Vibrio casei]|uniref:lytic polysaccharide monooxygenase n=1 Tax=Vibrio casei TaxID=673372 RepID=UPI003F948424